MNGPAQPWSPTEYAPKGKRGLYAMFPQLGPSIGNRLPRGVLRRSTVVGEAAPSSAWGWRIPFLSQRLLVLVGMYIRLKLEETPMFSRLTRQPRSGAGPLVGVFKHQPR